MQKWRVFAQRVTDVNCRGNHMKYKQDVSFRYQDTFMHSRHQEIWWCTSTGSHYHGCQPFLLIMYTIVIHHISRQYRLEKHYSHLQDNLWSFRKLNVFLTCKCITFTSIISLGCFIRNSSKCVSSAKLERSLNYNFLHNHTSPKSMLHI